MRSAIILVNHLSMDLQILLPIVLLALTVIRLWMMKFKIRNPRLPPQPWKLPLIGNMHLFIGTLPHRCLRDLAIKHGPVMYLELGELSTIVISSAEAAQQVMKTHDLNFANRPSFPAARIWTYDYTNISFAPYGDYWRQLRKICTMELLSSKRVQSFQAIREEEVSNLIASIKAASTAGSPVNLQNLLRSLTFKITARAAFGSKCKDHELFSQLVQEMGEVAGGFSLVDAFPSIKLLQHLSGRNFQLQKFHAKSDNILENIIDEHRTAPKIEDKEEVKDLVHVLLNLKDHGDLEIPLTDSTIKAVIQDMLSAGGDTTSMTIEWAMSEIIKNPRVLEKAQAEVRQVLDKSKGVKEEGLSELKYLKLVIKETLRLHPPAPLLLPKESMERCEVNGYEIPTKSRIIVNAWAIGRDPKYWDDAERFNPERFIDDAMDFKGNNFNFIPFGGGRRICPGIVFGLAIIELPLAQLLLHFDWVLPNGKKAEDLDMNEAFGVSVPRKNELSLVPISY